MIACDLSAPSGWNNFVLGPYRLLDRGHRQAFLFLPLCSAQLPSSLCPVMLMIWCAVRPASARRLAAALRKPWVMAAIRQARLRLSLDHLDR
jgi:hypothetical protein